MKKPQTFMTLLTMAFIGVAFSGVSFALQYLGDAKRMSSSKPIHVSMLFHKVGGHDPNLEAWAAQTESYKRAPDKHKPRALKQLTDELKHMYGSINEDTSIVVHVTADIPPYSDHKGGFLIENFNSELFFSYRHLGYNFAVIPIDISSYRWFTVPEELLMQSGMDVTKKNTVNLQLLLTPKSADTKAPAILKKKKHWMLASEIKEIQLWSPEGNIIWSMKKPKKDTSLLDLYQK